jgi:PLP dependent protein
VAKDVLADKLKAVRDRIEQACTRAKRDPASVSLVAVTKYAAPDQIRELLGLGVGDLGESRVQQLVQRAGQLNEYHQRRVQYGEGNMPAKLRWHMIGHLQRNKVRQLLPVVSLVHSIDSLRLAEEIDAAGEKAGKKIPVLLQVNASEEGQKSGVAVGATVPLAEQIATMEHVQLVGLMTMAAHDAGEVEIRNAFRRTRELFQELQFHRIGGASLRHLSMGMSSDFEHAIAEGSTMVRIGTDLFGGKPEQLAAEEKED